MFFIKKNSIIHDRDGCYQIALSVGDALDWLFDCMRHYECGDVSDQIIVVKVFELPLSGVSLRDGAVNPTSLRGMHMHFHGGGYRT